MTRKTKIQCEICQKEAEILYVGSTSYMKRNKKSEEIWRTFQHIPGLGCVCNDCNKIYTQMIRELVMKRVMKAL